MGGWTHPCARSTCATSMPPCCVESRSTCPHQPRRTARAPTLPWGRSRATYSHVATAAGTPTITAAVTPAWTHDAGQQDSHCMAGHGERRHKAAYLFHSANANASLVRVCVIACGAARSTDARPMQRMARRRLKINSWQRCNAVANGAHVAVRQAACAARTTSSWASGQMDGKAAAAAGTSAAPVRCIQQ